MRNAIAAWAGVLIALAAGGTWAATGAVTLWSGDDQFVRIEAQDDPGASPNDHPATLDAAAISNALAALQLRIVDSGSGSETQRAVFTRDELGRLAPIVASGLAKAGPKQDVTFSTLGSHALGPGGLVKDPRLNAGRVFYEAGKLNVIFGELQSNYRKKNIYGQRTEDFSPRRLGTRTKAGKQEWNLRAAPGVTLHRADWVEIDPSVAAASTPPATSAPANAPPEAAETRPAVAAPPPAPVAAPPAPPAPAATTGSSTALPAASPDKADATLEQRLRRLKDLRDKGLISEEAYQAKVQELLKEL